MYLMYYTDDQGKRVYTLKVRARGSGGGRASGERGARAKGLPWLPRAAAAPPPGAAQAGRRQGGALRWERSC